LFHEHLEGVNEPVYFHHFAQRAAAHGLQYLAEADLCNMVLNQFAPAVGKTLSSISNDLIQLEQYMDFVRNRTFRQTLLCHKDVVLNRVLSADSLAGLCVASRAQPVSANPDIQSDAVEQFRSSAGMLSTPYPIVKAAMFYLGQVWPEAVPFESLVEAAQSCLDAVMAPHERSRAADRSTLGSALLESYTSPYALVDLHAQAPRLAPQVSDCPVASPLARMQAQASANVTNLRHETVCLGDLERQVLCLLDGSRDCGALIRDMQDAMQQGLFVVHHDGAAIQDRERAKGLLKDMVEQTLPQFARSALLAA
jgi:methyltransferase-like protein